MSRAIHIPAIPISTVELTCTKIVAVILSGFDAALVGSLVGVESFREQFGYLYEDEYVINAAWLGALNYAGLVGNCIGTLVAGYSYDRLGPRMTLGACCVASVGWIFMQFFSASVALLFVGELGNGVITGCYPVVAMAYISEVCPVVLRGVITSGINLYGPLFILFTILSFSGRYTDHAVALLLWVPLLPRVS